MTFLSVLLSCNAQYLCAWWLLQSQTDQMWQMSTWLSGRQLPNGGLNGRPEILADPFFFQSCFCHASHAPIVMVMFVILFLQACDSCWVLSAFSILNKSSIKSDVLHFICSGGCSVTHCFSYLQLTRSLFICEGGDIPDRHDNMVGMFHTHFGIAGMYESNLQSCFLLAADPLAFCCVLLA